MLLYFEFSKVGAKSLKMEIGPSYWSLRQLFRGTYLYSKIRKKSVKTEWNSK